MVKHRLTNRPQGYLLKPLKGLARHPLTAKLKSRPTTLTFLAKLVTGIFVKPIT